MGLLYAFTSCNRYRRELDTTRARLEAEEPLANEFSRTSAAPSDTDAYSIDVGREAVLENSFGEKASGNAQLARFDSSIRKTCTNSPVAAGVSIKLVYFAFFYLVNLN